jgi:acyl carrier protein
MVATLEETASRAKARQRLCGEDVNPELIGDDQPLFGRGLELDSIDTLELAMAIEESYGVTITDDETESLLSLNRLVDHVEANRPQ